MFPEIAICRQCGFAEFIMSEEEQAMVEEVEQKAVAAN